jgi:NADPH2:quinone reductase
MHRLRLLTRQLQPNFLSNANRLPYSTMTSIPETMKALQIHSQGGLDVLAMHDVPVPKPKKDEVLIKVEYAGVNYIDTYQRSGLYKMAMPTVLGNEAAGTVEQVGSKVQGKGLANGDLVATYCPGGAFAQYVSVARSKIYKVSENVDAKLAAASLLQGLTGES